MSRDLDLRSFVDAPVVEVAALLGDTVITTKHVDLESARARPRSARLFFAAGALLLATAGIAFGVAVRVSASDSARLRSWTEVEGRSSIDFRPHRLGAGWDALVFGGILGGIAAITVGLWRRRSGGAGDRFLIGRAAGVDLATGDAPLDAFPLVAPAAGGDRLVVHVAHGMTAERWLAGASVAVDALATGARPSASFPGAVELDVGPGERLRVRCGLPTFVISAVPAPRRLDVGGLRIERAQAAFLGGSVLLHAGILALLYSLPPDPRGLSLDVLGDSVRFARVRGAAHEEPPTAPQENDRGEADGQGHEATSMALAGEPGKMGPDDATGDHGRFRVQRRGPTPQLTHDEAMRHARQAGILGAIGPNRPQAFAALAGTGDFASGVDDRDVYGGYGDQDGEMRGNWGYAPEGTGPGGGGTGWDTIGVGRYATIGHEWGTSREGGWRAGVMRRPAHEDHAPTTVTVGGAEVPGDYRPIVRRYIRQRLARIQHCYERQLLIEHDLQGTVTVRFVIGPDGSVLSSRGTGMGSAEVEQCVAEVVKGIAFPRPTGGMMLNITYPFIFRPAGS